MVCLSEVLDVPAFWEVLAHEAVDVLEGGAGPCLAGRGEAVTAGGLLDALVMMEPSPIVGGTGPHPTSLGAQERCFNICRPQPERGALQRIPWHVWPCGSNEPHAAFTTLPNPTTDTSEPMLASTEQSMWVVPPRDRTSTRSVAAINEKYERGEQRIVTEMNREKLPNFVEALSRSDYMEVRPFYQRRSRWDEERQSKLIESFIINIPVPPIFLYERAFNSYEVMDGQQRITAISDFYQNRFKLKGLDLWPELNGFAYRDLPNKIRAGLDRRSISSIVLLKESAPDEEEAVFLRQLVFERLNTGGIKLERQEIRNSLSHGPFNEMLYELARLPRFREIWNLPAFTEEELSNHKLPIYENSFFKTMEDIEVVLRFFALRHMKYYRYGIQGFLDLYMVRSKQFTPEDITFLADLYRKTLECAYGLYGEHIFRLYSKEKWSEKPVKGMYDAVMVSLSECVNDFGRLLNRKEAVLSGTIALIQSEGASSLTGRASTKRDLENRIDLFRQLFHHVLQG